MRLCGGRFGPASTPHDAGGAAHADSLVVDLGVAFSVPFSCGASHSHPGAPNASPFASQACGTVERFTAAYVFSLGIARGLNCAHWLLQLTSREASRALNVRDRFSLLWQHRGALSRARRAHVELILYRPASPCAFPARRATCLGRSPRFRCRGGRGAPPSGRSWWSSQK